VYYRVHGKYLPEDGVNTEKLASLKFEKYSWSVFVYDWECSTISTIVSTDWDAFFTL